MPPRKPKPAGAKAKAAPEDDDADLDAVLDAAIRANEAVAGSPAALRLVEYTCGGCGAGQPPLKCGGCAVVRYCGEQCQKAHWSVHKARCRELKVEATA